VVARTLEATPMKEESITMSPTLCWNMED
jgi:hypothetical protein